MNPFYNWISFGQRGNALGQEHQGNDTGLDQ
jgi:hypothetical protein